MRRRGHANWTLLLRPPAKGQVGSICNVGRMLRQTVTREQTAVAGVHQAIFIHNKTIRKGMHRCVRSYSAALTIPILVL